MYPLSRGGTPTCLPTQGYSSLVYSQRQCYQCPPNLQGAIRPRSWRYADVRPDTGVWLPGHPQYFGMAFCDTNSTGFSTDSLRLRLDVMQDGHSSNPPCLRLCPVHDERRSSRLRLGLVQDAALQCPLANTALVIVPQACLAVALTVCSPLFLFSLVVDILLGASS